MLRFTLATFLALGVLLPGQVVSQDLPPNLITANALVSPGDQPDRRTLLELADQQLPDYKLLADAKMFHYSQEAKSLTHDIEADFNFIEEFSKIIGRKIFN